MQKYLIAFVFMLIANFSFAGLQEVRSADPKIHHYNLSKKINPTVLKTKRNFDFPTQIINMTVDVTDYNLSCTEVIQKADQILDKLIDKNILIQGGLTCVGMNAAEYFEMSVYFDPIDEEARHYLEQYIAEHQGMDFYGQPLNIQAVKAIIVLLNIEPGMMDAGKFEPMHIVSSPLYFNGVYDMEFSLVEDIVNKLNTNDSELITSFMQLWADARDIPNYLESLNLSNFVKIKPEMIFIMDTNKVFKPTYGMVFEHDCSEYPSKKCLG